MKRVLIVSENFTGGGLETRIAEQVKIYNEVGIEVFLFCNKYDHKHDGLFSRVELIELIPRNGVFSSKQLLRTTKKIVAFCKKNEIDMIDCQPFWSIFPAVIAANKLNLPITYTAHGQASADFIEPTHFGARILFDTFLKYGVDELILTAEYVINHVAFPPQKICIVRNGLIANDLPTIKAGTSKYWALISRLDRIKGKLIQDFCPLITTGCIKKLDIYGTGEYTDKIKKTVSDLSLDKAISFKGWVDDVPKTLEDGEYSGVIGMGRCILESMAMGLPSLVLGYGGADDVITKENITYFKQNNFTSWKKSKITYLVDRINDANKNPDKYNMSNYIKTHLNSKTIWQQRIKQLHKLKHRHNDFDRLLTFWSNEADFDLLLNNEKVIAEVTELINDPGILERRIVECISFNNLLQSFSDQIDYLRQENYVLSTNNAMLGKKFYEVEQTLRKMEASKSWKITKPLRDMSKFLK